jgi:hypothetical protein
MKKSRTRIGKMIKKKGQPLFGQPLVLFGGAGENRTRDLLNAIQALSQLSYNPMNANVLRFQRPLT